MPATAAPPRPKVTTKKSATTKRKTPTPKRSSANAPARRASKKRAITPEDLLRFVFAGDPQVSPDGAQIAFTRKHVDEKKSSEYVTNIWLVRTDAKCEPRQYTSGGKDTQPRWSRDGSRLAFVSSRVKRKPQVYVMNATGGEATALTTFPEGSIGKICWSPDGAHIAVSFREQAAEWTEDSEKERKEKGLSDPPRVLDTFWYRLDGDGYFNGQRYHLFIVDANTGETRSIYMKDTMGFFTFDFSPDGKKIAVSTNRHARAGLRPWNDEILIIDVASGKAKPVPNLPNGPKERVQWSPDGTVIAYAGREGPDSVYSTENLELWVCDPARGSAKCLTGGEDYCLLAVALTDTAEVEFGPWLEWSHDSRRVYVKIGWHGEMHLASVGRNGSSLTFHTSGPRAYHVQSFSDNGRVAGLTVGSSTKLDEIHVGQFSGQSLSVTPLTSFNDSLLDELNLSEPEDHWVTSADGNPVHLWVMRPPGAAKTAKLPGVLEIHGGPHAQYGWGFFHEFQVLAANGYVVVYSNPRGSKGYGRDHCHAIRGHWGTADWVDIQAVAEFMKKRKDIDSKRMGVMGGSYGGYMTNWAIAHTHDFAGAITDRCVSNLVSMAGSSDFMEMPDLYFPGAPWDRPEDLWQSSPIKHFKGVKTPTLIIHSEGDLRCNVEQAEQVHAALCVQNVPTRFVRYPRSTSHGLSRGGPPDLRLHRLHQILGWWKKYLGPKRRKK